MTFEEQLTRAFDTLTERLRGEIDSHVRRASAELIAAAPYDRDPAVLEAARAELERAVAAARQEAHQAGHSAGEEAARLAALAELEAAVAAARQEAHQAGHSAGEEAARLAALAELEAAVAAARQEAHQAGHSAGEEAARIAALAELEAAVAAARQEAHQAGRSAGEEAARTAARKELESAVAAARREAHDAGLAAGIDAGLAEGREAGRAAALEEIQARAPQPTDSAPGPALMDAVRTIEQARSLTEILDALVSAASADAARAEVWLHRGGGLHRWRSPAAGDGTPVEPATSPQNDRIIADALRTNAIASADGAVAVPIAIGGAVVAVLVAQRARGGSAERRTPNDERRAVGPLRCAVARSADRVQDGTCAHAAAGAGACRDSAGGARRSARRRRHVGAALRAAARLRDQAVPRRRRWWRGAAIAIWRRASAARSPARASCSSSGSRRMSGSGRTTSGTSCCAPSPTATPACWKSEVRSQKLEVKYRNTFFTLAVVAAVLAPGEAVRAQAQSQAPGGADVVLKPTNHPRLPTDASQLWLAPAGRATVRSAALNDFATGVKLEVDSNFAKALPIFLQPAVRQGTLGHYAEYYQGLAELRLGRAVGRTPDLSGARRQQTDRLPAGGRRAA